jgi:hypothetical protein
LAFTTEAIEDEQKDEDQSESLHTLNKSQLPAEKNELH